MPLLTEESLNDFFLPSQDCIKPVEIKKTYLDSEIKVDNGVHWEVSKDGTETQLEAASISLNDCLACSGCVTTAESVLIGLQSWGEVEATLQAATKKVTVASVCPQSVASIAASFDLSVEATFRKLQTLLGGLGFAHVLSTNIGREVSLHESAAEFIRHHEAAGPKGPLLASACPGWICYAEKQKSTLIPTISKVRSPQQLTGVMLKDVVVRTHGVSREEVYHVAIMPCFDKKLEASRQEFQVEAVRDVDTVVTSAEVTDMIRHAGIDFASLDESAARPSTDSPSSSPFSFSSIPASGRQPGSSSGGYLAHILTTAAHKLHGIHLSPDLDPVTNARHLRITPQKSPKLKEFEVLDDDGAVVLRFAEAYGFRQITSLTAKLAPKIERRTHRRRPNGATGGGGGGGGGGGPKDDGAARYDYVEVMACEQGCINGGGQVRSPADTTHRDWIARVETLYRTESERVADGRGVDAILAWWTGTSDPDRPVSEADGEVKTRDGVGRPLLVGDGDGDWREGVRGKMVTTYNEIPPLVNPLASKW